MYQEHMRVMEVIGTTVGKEGNWCYIINYWIWEAGMYEYKRGKYQEHIKYGKWV